MRAPRDRKRGSLRGAGSKLYRKAMQHKYGDDWKDYVSKCKHGYTLDGVCQACGARV